MGLVVPDALEVEILQTILNTPFTLRIFGNNVVPVGGNSAASYTEIAGGGYANLPLTYAHWSFTGGTPSIAVYDATQVWTFTGPVNAPGTIYGYYITRNSDGKLLLAERFPAALVPFVTIAGSIIKVLPKFTAQSQF